MRGALVPAVWMLCLCTTTPAWAQHTGSSSSLQRVRVGLEKPPSETMPDTPLWIVPERRNLGILTLTPPELRGEIVRVSLPIGELVTRAVRGLGAAKQRRAERKAQERVQREMSARLAPIRP